MGLGLVGCTSLTAVDWTLIPPPEAAPGGSASGGSASGGSDAAAGNNDAGGQPAGGQGGVASGAGGEGEGGYAGEVGGAPPDTAGSGGGGMGGVADVGGGGAASLGGMSGGGAAGTGGGGMAGTGGGGMAGTGGGATTLCSDYPTGPLATDFAGQIVLFDGGTKPAGAWGGRVGIDNACKQAALALGLTKKTVHALAAAANQSTQAINSNITANYAGVFEVPISAMIVSKFGIPMGTWSDFALAPKKSLICAGVFPADVTEWFSGVNSAGDGDEFNNCTNWTFGEPSVEIRAFAGRTDTIARAFHEHWLSDHWVTCDSPTTHLLCLAWGD